MISPYFWWFSSPIFADKTVILSVKNFIDT